VFSALMVVVSSNPVRGALFLVLTFFCMATLWLLLHAEFLAIILVLVYVGAVMTLFLFVVMMLSVSRVNIREGFVRYLPISGLIIVMVTGIAIMVVGPHHLGLALMPSPPQTPADYSNTASLGLLLYTYYAYPFEIAAVVLLTAIVAAITLTHNQQVKKHKAQRVSQQIAVRAQDRLRLIDMPSEPKHSPSQGPKS
jgi:NADH-quinone oxidoreductase subunit J